MGLTLTAILLGIVEGLTEFLPVSSTGHLILATEIFGYNAAEWAVFNIVIQLGAILAVVYQYWPLLWKEAMGVLKLEREGLLFARNILAAFMPAAVLGLLFKPYIDILLQSPIPVCWALIVGGIAIIVIERYVHPEAEEKVSDLPLKTVVGIGFAQCLAMVPGVSRSAATIMGALLMGVNRKTAAEFSFFLAIPTMLGATTVEVAQNISTMNAATPVGWGLIALGFAVAFIVALFVIRLFIAYVSKYSFTPFGWYRIVIGGAALAWLLTR